MSDDDFVATTRKSIESLTLHSPDIVDDVRRICDSYENYFKKKYELERKERICEMETNMALRRENIDLRAEVEALQVVIGQLKDDLRNANTSRLDTKKAQLLNFEKADGIVEANNANFPMKQDPGTKFLSEAGDSVKSENSGNEVATESSRPRGTSIFGDLNDFFVNDDHTLGIDAKIYNNGKGQDVLQERGGRQPTSTLDKVLNSRKGSYFSVENDDSPRVHKVDGEKQSKPLMSFSSDRVSPALKLDAHLNRSDFDASGMLGYGPTKTESDLAQRLAKLSGHSDLSPNELALALARSVHNSSTTAGSNTNAHSI